MRQSSKKDLRGVRCVLTHLLLHHRHLVTRIVGRHRKCAYTLLSRSGIGDREHDGQLSMFTRGDELLGAVDDILIAVAQCAGLQCSRIRSGLRLGEAEAAQHPAGGERTQVLLLQIVAAEVEQRTHTTELLTLRMVEQAPSPAAISSIASAKAT